MNFNGAMVTMVGPFFINEIGTVTCAPAAPLALPIVICGPPAGIVGVTVAVGVAVGGVPPPTLTNPLLPVPSTSLNWSSDIPARTKVTGVDELSAALALIVNEQSMISPSGMITVGEPENTMLIQPADGVPVQLADGVPASTFFPDTFDVQLPNVSTFGSMLKASGATVTMLCPFLAREMGTVT
jgi:hypothetical protein